MHASVLRRPDPLKPGDTVALMALASKIEYEKVIPQAVAVLEQWGLKVVEGPSLKSKWHTFAGTDEIRRADYQRFLDDPSIKAIISARGGYGSSRILDSIDYRAFQQHPKWVAGFSDITAVLCDIYRLGIESLHSTMPKLFFQDETGYSLESLRKLLFGEEVIYQTVPQSDNRYGKAEGMLVGGNLCLFVHMSGSPADVDTKGKILFLEETEEFHYSVDRYMVQLRRAGKLEGLAGLIVGSFSELRDKPEDFGMSIREIIQYWVKEYSFPVAYGFPVGHEAGNLALPVGRNARLTVAPDEVRLEFV